MSVQCDSDETVLVTFRYPGRDNLCDTPYPSCLITITSLDAALNPWLLTIILPLLL